MLRAEAVLEELAVRSRRMLPEALVGRVWDSPHGEIGSCRGVVGVTVDQHASGGDGGG